MGKVLAVNVFDHESQTWYGPAYGNEAKVPDEVAERFGEHVWAAEAEAAAEEEVEAKPLDKRSKGELIDLAEVQDPPIDTSGTKAEILERLVAAGIQG